MTRIVSLMPAAQHDLLGVYGYIAPHSGSGPAFAYVSRIRDYCAGFADFPERGTRRDDIRPGLRTISFERRVLIAFHVTDEIVFINRILYGGRSLGSAFNDNG